ncbi:hypothetical protein D3C79_882330 [compost metagenome]
MPPALQHAADGVDQRIQGHTAKQDAIERQDHRFQVPEAHGEPLAQFARHLQAGGVRGNQFDHHQRQAAHAGVDQGIDAVENDRERTGCQAEGDADGGDEQGDGDRGA